MARSSATAEAILAPCLQDFFLILFLAASPSTTEVVATPATAEEAWGAAALAGWGAAADTAAAFAAAGAASMKLGNSTGSSGGHKCLAGTDAGNCVKCSGAHGNLFGLCVLRGIPSETFGSGVSAWLLLPAHATSLTGGETPSATTEEILSEGWPASNGASATAEEILSDGWPAPFMV